jgi:hypothetical protein
MSPYEMTTSLQGCRNLSLRAIPESRLEISEDGLEVNAATIHKPLKFWVAMQKENNKLKYWAGDLKNLQKT